MSVLKQVTIIPWYFHLSIAATADIRDEMCQALQEATGQKASAPQPVAPTEQTEQTQSDAAAKGAEAVCHGVGHRRSSLPGLPRHSRCLLGRLHQAVGF